MEACEITIITPVYNRAHCISHCYESLRKQTCKNFVWMVIDDGSTDHLELLIQKWQSEEKEFKIAFYQKENGGKSTAYNLALKHIQTPYWTCIDSDDWITDITVERYYHWIRYTEHLDVAGFVGLDSTPDGTVLGGNFPYEGIASLMDVKTRIRHEGDMNMVYRTDLSKRFSPMPEVEGEKDFEPYYFLLKMDEVAPLYLVNEVFCIADYQSDGLTQNVWRAYFRSPVSMGMLRLEFLRRKHLPWGFAYRQCIHYVSSWLLAQKNPAKKKQLPLPVMRPFMILAWIPGWLFSKIIVYKNDKRLRETENGQS